MIMFAMTLRMATTQQNPVLGKIGSLFDYKRRPDGTPTGETYDRLTPEMAAIVAASCPGGIPLRITAKVDGTCCWIHNGALWARQDLKRGRAAPDGWIPTAGEEPDAGGHIIGFRPLDPAGGADKWHHRALCTVTSGDPTAAVQHALPSGNVAASPHRGQHALFLENGKAVVRPLADYEGHTVELVGPSIGGNRHGLTQQMLIVHGSIQVDIPDWTTHAGLSRWLTEGDGRPYEGIVVHVMDGSGYIFKCHRGHLGLDARTWGVGFPLIKPEPAPSATPDAATTVI